MLSLWTDVSVVKWERASLVDLLRSRLCTSIISFFARMKLVPLSENNSSGVPHLAQKRRTAAKTFGSEFCTQLNVNKTNKIAIGFLVYPSRTVKVLQNPCPFNRREVLVFGGCKSPSSVSGKRRTTQ